MLSWIFVHVIIDRQAERPEEANEKPKENHPQKMYWNAVKKTVYLEKWPSNRT